MHVTSVAILVLLTRIVPASRAPLVLQLMCAVAALLHFQFRDKRLVFRSMLAVAGMHEIEGSRISVQYLRTRRFYPHVCFSQKLSFASTGAVLQLLDVLVGWEPGCTLSGAYVGSFVRTRASFCF